MRRNATSTSTINAIPATGTSSSCGYTPAPSTFHGRTANAYDDMHLVALAIEKAGAADGAKVRDALENLGEYRGLIKTYTRQFTPEEHDALTEKDYILVTWKGGRIVPVAN